MRGLPMAMTGTVKFFNGERGYGFIKPDEGSHDVFPHLGVAASRVDGFARRTTCYI